MQPVSKQWISKHASTTIGLLLEMVFSLQSTQSGYKRRDGATVQFSSGMAIELSPARESEKRWHS
jgi:hypothetical protein